MTSRRELKRSLDSVMPGAIVVMAAKEDETIDTAILVSKKITVQDQGSWGTGQLVWVIIETAIGEVSIMGIHAPGKRRERAELWKWMRQKVELGRWILMGDMNMVEYRRDSIGPSPLMRGRELRKWTINANAGDLVDVWLEAVRSMGPWYTRQAFHGGRLDQSRLDRCYLTNRGDWLYLIDEMVHDGTSSLAYHVPIKARLILQGEVRNEGKKSYFKMDGSLLNRDDVRTECEEVWREHPWWVSDDRKKWGLALARVRKVLLRHKNSHNRGEAEAAVIQNRLAEIRLRVQDNPSSDNKRLFEEALCDARRHEQLDTRICRIRCRIRWLQEGDVSSRFFYACLKAKTAREEVKTLKLDTSEVVNDEGRILQLIEEAYRDLYTAEPEEEGIQETREQVLTMVDKKLTISQNRTLEEQPTEGLIKEIVRSLPKEKSHGFDGVTAEVLVAGWNTLSGDCYRMVWRVWNSRRLLSKDNRGIIPKADELFLLKNWRPITLLTTTYKIIAKIIAWRLRDMLPDIIDQQQTGFIAGRSIVENILTRVVLLNQVLAATPLYQMLSVGMEQAGIDGLETLCRHFLWGWNDQENPKVSLVAWERITQRKEDGGLGWTSLREKAMALQVRNIIKVITESNAEWTKLARHSSYATKWKISTGETAVASGRCSTSISKINGSRTLTRMLTAWNRIRKKLAWDNGYNEIPDHLTLEQGLHLMLWGNKEGVTRLQRATGIIRKASINTVQEGKTLLENNGSWLDALAANGQFPDEQEKRDIQQIESWLRTKTLVSKDLIRCEGWKWASDGEKVVWNIATKDWMTRVRDRKVFSAYLNSKWRVDDSEQTWTTRWVSLWRAAVHHRRKTWIWRWIQRGYFTGNRGKG
ncbi:hypothetical protein R1sor_025694 [Riccia sorocarpa]|uniref:Reverse transcriptase domain-containing protein n=1 Tax=Riccia sorocarpa TaxID=122646 RepID=A0ABD3GD04_9MARC